MGELVEGWEREWGEGKTARKHAWREEGKRN